MPALLWQGPLKRHYLLLQQQQVQCHCWKQQGLSQIPQARKILHSWAENSDACQIGQQDWQNQA
jgi:hypothetical protein